MKKTVFLSLFTAVLLAAGSALAAAPVYCTWATPTADGPHPVIVDKPATLRATVVSSLTGLKYKWTYGDGTVDAAFTPVSDKYVIEGTHTYTGTVGSIVTATLRVYKANNSLLGSDTYRVQLAAATDTVALKKIAIEQGLWYLHKQMVRDTTTASGGAGQPRGWLGKERRYTAWDGILNTLVSASAFTQNGFQAAGTAQNADNPYTNDVQRLANFVTERLAILPIAHKGGGSTGLPDLDPEAGTTKNHVAVAFDVQEMQEYEQAAALRFLAKTGYVASGAKPKAFNPVLNRAGAAYSIGNWTYKQIVQEMVDYFAWLQLYEAGHIYDGWCTANDPLTGLCTSYHWEGCLKTDSTGACLCYTYDEYGVCIDSEYRHFDSPTPYALNPLMQVPPQQRGSWPYWTQGPGDVWKPDVSTGGSVLHTANGAYGDTSIAYWVVGALRAAVSPGPGDAALPSFVKNELRGFLQLNQNLDSSSPYYGEFHFSEAYDRHYVERAGQALDLFTWVGGIAAQQFDAAKYYLANFWDRHNEQHGANFPGQTVAGTNSCYNELTSEPDDCFTHFKLDGWPTGHNVCLTYGCWSEETCTKWDLRGNCIEAVATPGTCSIEYQTCVSAEWVDDGALDDVNLYGFMNIVNGLQAAGVTGFPAAAPNDYKTLYLNSLLKNNINGAWGDTAWAEDSYYGTGWALMILAKL